MFRQRSTVFSADEKRSHQIPLLVGVFAFRKQRWAPDSPLHQLDIYGYSLLLRLEKESERSVWYQWLLVAFNRPAHCKQPAVRVKYRTTKAYFGKAVRDLEAIGCIKRTRHPYWPYGFEIRLTDTGRTLAEIALSGQ